MSTADDTQRFRAALADSYVIERELGRGGMGIVFLARDLKHHRPVAIKTLDPELAAFLGPRFLREIEIAGRLQHPHILTVLDSGEAGGVLYYVMPFVEGESLRQRLDREHQLPVEDAVRLTAQVASALDEAHRHGVVHRDVKPENILLSGGHAMVADFGIARAVQASGGTRLSSSGLMLGTPAYMSPEQSVPSSDIDSRSDIYSLGCMMYEMLAGQPPFTGATAESVIHQHLAVDPRPVSDVRRSTPPGIVKIIECALAKSPADRFASAAAMIDALAHWNADATMPRGRPGGRRWASVAAMSAVTVVVAALVIHVVCQPRLPSSVAVLPLDNLTGDPGLEYLCDGVAAEIQSNLVRVTDLNVASRTSSWSIRGTEADATTVSRELGVHAVLEGAVQKRGEVFRVDLQLVNGRTGYVMWSAQLERSMHDLPYIIEEVVPQVAGALRGGFTAGRPGELARPPTRSPPAYDYYLQAGRVLEQSDDPLAPDQAAALYERAIALDEDFALAHAGLSRALWRVFQRTMESATCERAEAESEIAIRINPELLEARLARAQMSRARGRYAEAIAELGRILNVNPNWDEAHLHLAACYREAGDLDAAEESILRATRIRPRYWKNWNSLGALRIKKGDYAGARASFQHIVELAPDMNRGYEQLAALAMLEGKYRDAIAVYEKLPAPVNDAVLATNIGTAYFFIRRLDEAERHYLEARRLDPRNPDRWKNLGDLYLRQGRQGRAHNAYRQALRLVEDRLELNPDDRELALERVLVLAKAGECALSATVLADLRSKLPESDAQCAHSIAMAHALCGRRHDALEALSRALAMGISAEMVRDEDEFRSLANDPEFQRLTAGQPAGR